VCVSLLAITGCTLFMAQFIPTAFGDRGRQFAVAYALVRLAGLGLYWAGLHDRADERTALWTFLPYSACGAVLVLVGGFVPVGGRPWVWLVAAAVDASSTFAAGRGEFHVRPAHFAERHALFVIIALGESIVSVGVAGSREDLDPTAVRYLAAAAAIVVIASLWWAYFDWLREASERTLEETPQATRGRLARDLYTLGHVTIVAGTVVFAVGVEAAVAEPLRPFTSFGRWAVGGGIVLYLLGFVFAHARANHALLLERLVGAALVGVFVGVAGRRVDAVWVLVVLAAINVALSASEAAQPRRRHARNADDPR